MFGDSLLVRELRAAGWDLVKQGYEETEKDFGCDENGQPMIGYFSTPMMFLKRGADSIHLYTSRFSGNWALNLNGRRLPRLGWLAAPEDLNSPEFVQEILADLEG